MSQKICAIIVTFNRRNLLKECLLAILNQTRPVDSILVVNNCSEDDTLEMLRKEFPTVKILNLDKNSGSAGGFYYGIKLAYEKNFDWFWLMDDDGIADKCALENLLKGLATVNCGLVLNSLVVDKSDHKKIAFGYNYGMSVNNKSSKNYYKLVDELIQDTCSVTLDGLAQFFNSTLLNRELVSTVGLPIPDLFIRGDELEYVYRIQKAGIKTYTVTNSLFFHPNPLMKELNLFGFHLSYEPMPPWKQYYSIRNSLFIDRVYSGYKSFLLGVFRKTVKSIIVEFSQHAPLKEKLSSLKVTVKAVIDSFKISSPA